MSVRGVYGFEGIDGQLDLVPLAARRALDHAGLKISLETWRSLPLETRAAIVSAGADDAVDTDLVRSKLAGVPTSELDALTEPTAGMPPASVTDAWPEAGAAWANLGGLDRWALTVLASRARLDSLVALVAEIVARRLPPG